MRDVVDTEQEFKQAVFDYETAGWEVVEQNQGRAVLQRGLRGSWIWHIPLLIFTLGYGNLLYLAYRWFDRPEKLVVRRRMENADEDAGTADHWGEETGRRSDSPE